MSLTAVELTPPDEAADLDEWLLGVEAQLADLLASFMRDNVPAAVEAYAASLTAAGNLDPFDVVEAKWAQLIVTDVGDVLGGVHQSGSLSAWVQQPSARKPPATFADQWANVVNLEAVDYQKAATNRIVGASTPLWNDVRRKTVSAVKVGMDNEDLTRAVEAVTGYSEFRANTIARTETVAAYNGGNYTGAQALGEQYGPAEKWWLAAEDARTRTSHAEADGQVVKFDQPFHVGGTSMSRPHDPAAPAAETVNCRCVMNLLYEGDTRPDGTTVTGRDMPIDDVEPEGPVISDADIAAWIREQLEQAAGGKEPSAAELIRKWKAMGRPVNDSRFRNIYRDVKEGGTGVRTVDKIGARAAKPAPPKPAPSGLVPGPRLNRHTAKRLQGKQVIYKADRKDPGKLVTVKRSRMVEHYQGGNNNVTLVQIEDAEGLIDEVPAGRLFEQVKPDVDPEGARRFHRERMEARRNVEDYTLQRADEWKGMGNEFAPIETWTDRGGHSHTTRRVTELGRAANESVSKVGRAVDDEIYARAGIRHADLRGYQDRYTEAARRERAHRGMSGHAPDYLQQATSDAERELNEARALYRSEALKLLEEERPGYGSQQVKVRGFREGGKAVAEAGRYYPAEWVEQMPEYNVKHVARGYHNSWKREIGISDEFGYNRALSTSQYDRVAVHEVGHAAEDVSVVRMAEELYNAERVGLGEVSRWSTHGERPVRWGGPGEGGYTDEWYSTYAGRDYGGRNFEIMSMGMEQLFGGQSWKVEYGGRPRYEVMDDDYAFWLLGVLMSL